MKQEFRNTLRAAIIRDWELGKRKFPEAKAERLLRADFKTNSKGWRRLLKDVATRDYTDVEFVEILNQIFDDVVE